MTDETQAIQSNTELEVIFLQGLTCHQADDHIGAARYWQNAAAAGHALAMYNLGCMYMRGLGLAPDHTKGLELLQMAAALDNENAVDVLRDFKNVGQSRCLIAAKAIDFKRRRRHILMALAALLILVTLTVIAIPNKFM